ncbi:hypothetical protein A2572_00010 [Candidatus Collierbacteria bacterium RIFOXYD1_FULL_40_9]|uniref:FCP1 homology domain-containing protein n=1 Tax=Candidatus Collierbacteria bacterium RIFOXYD1_FULL_40_9 TaxID=1817731 RepID=A0A1F5FWE2_9BACT|nr:MAG: hypothetical protein A2572_00010 [Candidatus Collierbacteria bacterium RIFOXYD1_FULL_40_9]
MKTILVDAAGTFVIEGQGVYRQLYELLETYPNRKIIVSNANDVQLIEYGIVNMPYEVFTLKHNPNKDNPEYFRILLNRFNLTVEDVLYFEHNQPAVDSAKSIGIASYFYDPDKKDLESLKQFLDQNL